MTARVKRIRVDTDTPTGQSSLLAVAGLCSSVLRSCLPFGELAVPMNDGTSLHGHDVEYDLGMVTSMERHHQPKSYPDLWQARSSCSCGDH